jgi:CHAT domain-containing protein
MVSLPRISRRHYERRNSNGIYETKNKIVFTTHNRSQQTTTNNQQPTTNNQQAQSWHQKISKSHRLSLKDSQTVYLVIVSRTDNLQQWLNSSTLAICSPCRLSTNPMTVLASQQPDKLTTFTPLNMKNTRQS